MYVPILSLDRVQRTLPFNDIIFWTLIESNDVYNGDKYELEFN